jgi:hypothetical protein
MARRARLTRVPSPEQALSPNNQNTFDRATMKGKIWVEQVRRVRRYHKNVTFQR